MTTDCPVCGQRTWRYERDVRVCMHGHKSQHVDGPLPVTAAPYPAQHYMEWGLASLTVIALSALAIVVDLLVK